MSVARPCSRPCSIAFMTNSSASSVDWQVRGETALVADGGVVAGVLQHLLQGVEDLDAVAQALGEGRRARRGRIMNSWKSIGLSACTPPLMMFIIGTGRRRAEAPPR